MDAPFLKEFINTICYLLPVLSLVWKGAKITSRVEQLEKDLEKKTVKFCRDHSNMEEKLEQERLATDSSIASIMATLTDIQKSLVRVETKLEERGK